MKRISIFVYSLICYALSLATFLFAFGFFALGCSLLYARTLAPDIDFRTLAYMRAAQTFGLAFLFVPNSTITYSTLPRELNGDGSALYVMIRNISGSIGISLSTAMIVQQTQSEQARLVQYMTPLWQPYRDTLQQLTDTFIAMGQSAAQAQQSATSKMFTTLLQQASIKAYVNVFEICAIAAFCIIPLTFLFKNTKPTGGAPAGH